MAKEIGTLTAAQLEVLEAVWEAGPGGATVAEIWGRVARRRQVARTTVLTVVGRLEGRGWLIADDAGPIRRYRAARTREEASATLAAAFVDEFFDGSAAGLVTSLLGSGRIKPKEVERLRSILGDARKDDRKGAIHKEGR
jgi:predicted transcriptional regulator